MAIPILVTGDDISLSVTLKKNDLTFTIPPSTAAVHARIVSTNHKEVYSPTVEQFDTTPGADWPNSLVVVEFAPADTSAILYQGKALVEIQVDDNGKRTWFVTVKLVTGQIS